MGNVQKVNRLKTSNASPNLIIIHHNLPSTSRSPRSLCSDVWIFRDARRFSRHSNPFPLPSLFLQKNIKTSHLHLKSHANSHHVRSVLSCLFLVGGEEEEIRDAVGVMVLCYAGRISGVGIGIGMVRRGFWMGYGLKSLEEKGGDIKVLVRFLL